MKITATDLAAAAKNKEGLEALASNVASLLTQDCREFISKAGLAGQLYRGLAAYQVNKFDTPLFVEKDVRGDRKPMSSTRALHDVLNQIIEDSGLTANRTNAVFCNSDPSEARIYGPVFVMFPVGRFEFTWSPQIRDAWRDVGMYEEDEDGVRTRGPVEIYAELKDAVEFKGNDNSLRDAMQTNHEILIKCDKVYLIEERFFKKMVLPRLLK